MNKSFALLFSLKTPKKLANGTVPIYLRISMDSTRAEIATKRYVLPEKWNHIAQKMIGNNEDARALNHYLKSPEQQVFHTHKELMELKLPLTAQTLKSRLLGESDNTIFLMDVFKDHNKQLAALVEKEYAPATIKRYDTAFRHVSNFLKWKYNKEDISIAEIDHGFVTSFEFYLRTVRKL